MADTETEDEETPVLGKLRRYDTHFHKKHVVLEVRNATFSVVTPKGPKRILNNLNMVAEAGESMALMGPSGAGKTTFLEMMTLGLVGGRATGKVTLNGKSLSFERFRKQAVYVEQYDTHWAFLTCRETMDFAASMYLPGDVDEQQERVEHVMEKLGLNECANTFAGNEFFKGMSGGQKKRLTLGMALLKGPVLMLLDEPTSGLDAASTRSVMNALKDMCKECHLIAIATIHQPATDVFLGFNKVMFLANGRTAYCGNTSDVVSYCTSIGKPLPPQTNPANFFIELINSEFRGRAEVDRMVEAWGNQHAKPYEGKLDDLPQGVRQKSSHQLGTVFRRQGLLAMRDPTLYIGRMAAFLICNVFFAIVYWKARPRQQEYVVTKMFLLGWFIAVPTMLSVIVVFASNAEFHLVKKEIKNGQLKTGAYVIATTVLAVPFMLLLSLVAIGLPGLLANWNFDAFTPMVLAFALTLWCYESCASFLGVMFKNAMLGMLANMAFWFTAFLFMGTLLQESLVIWPFNLLAQLLPLKWTALAMSYAQYHGTFWEGAEPAEGGFGFRCTHGALIGHDCFGYTGDQVMLTMSFGVSNVKPEDTRMESALRVFLIGLFFKVCQVVLVLSKSRQVSVIKDDFGDDSSDDE